MPGKTAFVVGTSDRRAVTVVVVRRASADHAPASPIHGPWTLKAVVSAN